MTVSAAPKVNLAEFEKLIRDNYESYQVFAKSIDVHPNTVTNWVSGTRRVPIVVVQHLRLIQRLKNLSRDF